MSYDQLSGASTPGTPNSNRLSLHYANSRESNETVELHWKNLSYSIAIKDSQKSTFGKPVYDKKCILKSISGNAKSGEMLAIMGPTGCGKTSLLNVLAARVSTEGSAFASLSGEVRVNGLIRDEDNFRGISAYVLQDDLMYAHLTVFETLLLSAHFFLPTELTNDAKTQLVVDVMTQLGLLKARDTIIGDEKLRGVSGGERKRANIAAQLISDPAVLFLDEPTSGLDSFQAQSVMESMKEMARNGRLVISVIHQPRSSIYQMFDKLLLLSEGNTMFYGDAESAVDYFAAKEFPCPALYNPADFFLDLLSPDSRSIEAGKLS